jgi:hypothetical protein
MKNLRILAAMLVAMPVAMPAVAAAEAADAPAHDKEYWRAIVAADYALPEGESAAALIRELSGLLGSTDPELRDEFGYAIPAQWIYVQRLLSDPELSGLVELWTANLQQGIGESGTDSVLKRSFSALDLSILAALDNQAPFLDQAGFGKLLDAALRYLDQEQDVRGFVPGTGWLHSVAHTADLLKFLGRSQRLKKADQARILMAIGSKMQAPDGKVYRHGEDERLARAVLSLFHRRDLDTEAVKRWLAQLAGKGDGLWDGTLDPGRYAEVQNTKNLLKSLFVILSAEEEGRTPATLRAQVLDTIQAL